MRWIIGVFFCCLLLLFAFSAPRATSDDCASFPHIKVIATTSMANPVYDFSTSIPELQTQANEIVHQVRMGWALGFTQTQPLLEMDVPTDVVPLGKGQFCARPRYVSITLGTRNETTTIPREILPESCAFKEVMEHEEKHSGINHVLAHKYTELAQQNFNNYFKNAKPVRAESAEEAVASQQKALSLILNDVAAKMIAENVALQQKVDAPDEYDRLLHVCNGELADIVKRVRDEQFALRQ